jgi:hypothetical protein
MTGISEQEYESQDTLEYRHPKPARSRPPHRIRFSLEKLSSFKRFRIVFPGERPKVSIAGINFQRSALHWPWKQKARLTLAHRDWEVGEMTFSFDPSHLLPEPVNTMPVTVMDDCGSSVLMRIDR